MPVPPLPRRATRGRGRGNTNDRAGRGLAGSRHNAPAHAAFHRLPSNDRPSACMNPDIILETRGLTKEFKGFVAVSKVDLQVRRGSIHALIGPNGAGKTTCFNLLTKFLKPTAGRILFEGDDITADAPAHIARRGVIRSFQISAVFPHLTVLENVRVALQRKLGSSFQFWRSERSLDTLNERARELLAAVDLAQYSGLTAVELSYGRKRALEIATTLAMDPKLMLLDEPTQGMGLEDVDRIKALIKKVAADRTVLMVEHNMSVVSSIADTITVLQRGATLAEGPYELVSKNPAVIEAYMGSAQTELVGAH
jgi:branched-chain amino acid transport system ATP-binding protein